MKQRFSTTSPVRPTADTITTGGLADTIKGGLGADTISGGGGADVFIVNGGLTVTTVGDFTAESDELHFDLSEIETSGAVEASTAFDYITIAAAGAAPTSTVAATTVAVATVAGATAHAAILGANVILLNGGGTTFATVAMMRSMHLRIPVALLLRTKPISLKMMRSSSRMKIAPLD